MQILDCLHVNKTNFLMKNFALELALKEKIGEEGNSEINRLLVTQEVYIGVEIWVLYCLVARTRSRPR